MLAPLRPQATISTPSLIRQLQCGRRFYNGNPTTASGSSAKLQQEDAASHRQSNEQRIGEE